GPRLRRSRRNPDGIGATVRRRVLRPAHRHQPGLSAHLPDGPGRSRSEARRQRPRHRIAACTMTTPADQQTRDASARRSAGLGTPRRATVIIIVCVCALVAGTVVLGLLQDRTNSVPLSVQGVTTTSAALADARPEGTVLITGADNLRTEQLEALATLEANVVLIGVDHADLGPVTDRFRIAGGGKEGTYSAECSDPAAS